MSKKHPKVVPAAGLQGKVPAQAVPARVSRIPVTASNMPDAASMKPSWRFVVLDHEGDWNWGNIDADSLRQVLERLRAFETRTWREIWSQTHEHHFIECHRLCSEARKRLVDIHLDDYDRLFSIRVTGRVRVWGVIEHSVFHILWWDPEHSVYPVGLRHT